MLYYNNKYIRIMENKFHEEYVKLAPIDKLREIGKCYGKEDVKQYKSNMKNDLIDRIKEKQKENKCFDVFLIVNNN